MKSVVAVYILDGCDVGRTEYSGGAVFTYGFSADDVSELRHTVRTFVENLAVKGCWVHVVGGQTDRHKRWGGEDVLQWFPPQWIDRVVVTGELAPMYSNCEIGECPSCVSNQHKEK